MSAFDRLLERSGLNWLKTKPEILIVNDEFMATQYMNPLFFKNAVGFETLTQNPIESISSIIDFASSDDDDMVPYPTREKALSRFDPLSYLSFDVLAENGYTSYSTFPDHMEFYLEH